MIAACSHVRKVIGLTKSAGIDTACDRQIVAVTRSLGHRGLAVMGDLDRR
jgi:hypothetical protein